MRRKENGRVRTMMRKMEDEVEGRGKKRKRKK